MAGSDRRFARVFKLGQASPHLSDSADAATPDQPSAARALACSTGNIRCRRTFDGSRALTAVESEDWLRVSSAGVEFILHKVAATVIPIRLRLEPPARAACFEGGVNRVDRDGGELHIQGPRAAVRLPLTDAHGAWIVNRSGAGGAPVHVAVFDRQQRPVAQLYGLRRQCIAWRALLQWLALRERGSAQPAPMPMPRIGTRRHAV